MEQRIDGEDALDRAMWVLAHCCRPVPPKDWTLLATDAEIAYEGIEQRISTIEHNARLDASIFIKLNRELNEIVTAARKAIETGDADEFWTKYRDYYGEDITDD